MPPKNLINQNQLIKISKTTPFHIRSKPKSVKICLLDRQSNNPDTPFDTHKEIDLCLDLIRNELKNNPQDKIYQRVAKLLQEVKIGWQPIECHTTELETEQNQMPYRPLRKSSSKHTHRNRIQAYEEFKVGELPPCPMRGGSEVKKNKAIRLKIGKQNHQNFFFTPKETRLEIVTHKLEQAEILINLQKNQLDQSKSQIQNLTAATQHLKQENTLHQQSIAQLQSQLQSVVEEKLCCESALEVKINVIGQLQRESCSLNDLLRMRLEEREQQIAAFWQLQAF